MNSARLSYSSVNSIGETMRISKRGEREKRQKVKEYNKTLVP